MAWWIWFVAGLFLLLLELITPGSLFFLFFGVAALLVGALAGLGMQPDWLQWLVFSAASVGSLLSFRNTLSRKLKAGQADARPVDSMIGATAVLTEDLPAGGNGKAELRGALWNVQNASEQALSAGQRCRVERVDGLKLIVRAE